MGPLSASAGRERGYTLIELLVVFAIVGIVIVTAALAWRDNSAAALEAEARRLASRIELALAQNQVAGRRIALSMDERGYAFWERDAAGLWMHAEAGEEPRSAVLPEGMSIESARFGGLRFAPGERLRLSMSDPLPMQIVIRAQGTRVLVATGEFAGRMHVSLLEANP